MREGDGEEEFEDEIEIEEGEEGEKGECGEGEDGEGRRVEVWGGGGGGSWGGEEGEGRGGWEGDGEQENKMTTNESCMGEGETRKRKYSLMVGVLEEVNEGEEGEGKRREGGVGWVEAGGRTRSHAPSHNAVILLLFSMGEGWVTLSMHPEEYLHEKATNELLMSL